MPPPGNVAAGRIENASPGRRPRAAWDPTAAMQPARHRDHVYRVVVRLLAVSLLPVAFLVAPRRARHVACQWALAARFPAEDLTGLTPATSAAFRAARTQALWRDGELIGLTSGHREARVQARLFDEAVRRTGSVALARVWALPPHESRHVAGTALDVRPAEGARWLERYGRVHHLHRVYDNEWWHFEYRPDGPPMRRAHPGAPPTRGRAARSASA
ncbi:D-alanyl-D-alanine carboxypeptidase family protein [Micromonospora sp. WMMD980]|uniref:D-alanyl-D-alanine carboxypeptidase family protein n=1 Tax=Micromonospora sp. WMMD980 TaxID=3016088 RepID=UPI0024173E7D|nr:D-alanyl-D-alanine carboxypeptidase family protein [Micromonospora sp. WMMD980]MDG4803262.1 D-alanyl-D-alanine carboxypeptidase family protein [Micromonospora sp. WMMD980]